MVLDLVRALNASELQTRLDAIENLTHDPDDARQKLVAILAEPSFGVRARVWAMIALIQVGCGTDHAVMNSLILCLDDHSAVVRRSAIDLLGHLKAHGAASKIAEHLNDNEPVEGAWFDDDATPGQAARRFLLVVDSPEAAALLANADRG
jgi:HEAT repeat protein